MTSIVASTRSDGGGNRRVNARAGELVIGQQYARRGPAQEGRALAPWTRPTHLDAPTYRSAHVSEPRIGSRNSSRHARCRMSGASTRIAQSAGHRLWKRIVVQAAAMLPAPREERSTDLTVESPYDRMNYHFAMSPAPLSGGGHHVPQTSPRAPATGMCRSTSFDVYRRSNGPGAVVCTIPMRPLLS